MRACPALTTHPLHMTDYSGSRRYRQPVRSGADIVGWGQHKLMRLERIWAQLEMPASQSTLASLKTRLESQWFVRCSPGVWGWTRVSGGVTGCGGLDVFSTTKLKPPLCSPRCQNESSALAIPIKLSFPISMRRSSRANLNRLLI
jgi:hypothetical protein